MDDLEDATAAAGSRHERQPEAHRSRCRYGRVPLVTARPVRTPRPLSQCANGSSRRPRAMCLFSTKWRRRRGPFGRDRHFPKGGSSRGRHPPGLRRGPHRREGHDRDRLPAPRAGLLHGARHHGSARDDRQWTRLRLPSTRSPAARSACATCARDPTGRGPTAKQNASSARYLPAGPTARSTIQPNKRTAALAVWLDHYNYRRPHGALSHQPPQPASRS